MRSLAHACVEELLGLWEMEVLTEQTGLRDQGRKRKCKPRQLSAVLLLAFRPLLYAHLPMFLQVRGWGGENIYLGLRKLRHKGLAQTQRQTVAELGPQPRFPNTPGLSCL